MVIFFFVTLIKGILVVDFIFFVVIVVIIYRIGVGISVIVEGIFDRVVFGVFSSFSVVFAGFVSFVFVVLSISYV